MPLKGLSPNYSLQFKPKSFKKSLQIVTSNANCGSLGRKLKTSSQTCRFLNCSSLSISQVCALIYACVTLVIFSYCIFWYSSKCLSFLSKSQLKTLTSTLKISVMRQPKIRALMMRTNIMQMHSMGFLGVMSPQAIVVTNPTLQYMIQVYICDQSKMSTIWSNAQLLQIQQIFGVFGPQQLFSQTHRLTRQKKIPIKCEYRMPTVASLITRQIVLQVMYNCVTLSNSSLIRLTVQNFKTQIIFIQLAPKEPVARGIMTDIMVSKSRGPSKLIYRRRIATESVMRSPSWQKALQGATNKSKHKQSMMMIWTHKILLISSSQKASQKPMRKPIYMMQNIAVTMITTSHMSNMMLLGLTTPMCLPQKCATRSKSESGSGRVD